MENSRDVCSACNARIEPGSKFCTECGKPVEESLPEGMSDVESGNEKVEDKVTLQSTVKCPQCNTELSSEDKFCIECGALIETSTNCPQCNAPLEPGARFCTECGTVIEATDEDWDTEYLAPILSLRVVDNLDQAIEHITEHSSQHTESIITENITKARRFLREVDSSSVMVNASTRFADGFEYGLGAEIGISTDKFHARGPVGLEGLTSVKFIVLGDGHIRE